MWNPGQLPLTFKALVLTSLAAASGLAAAPLVDDAIDPQEPDYFAVQPGVDAVVIDDQPDGSWRVVDRAKAWGTAGAIHETDLTPRLVVRNSADSARDVLIEVTYYSERKGTVLVLEKSWTLDAGEQRTLDLELPPGGVLASIRINDLQASVWATEAQPLPSLD